MTANQSPSFFERALDDALNILEAWAEEQPLPADPSEIIEDAVKFATDNPVMRQRLEKELWAQWARIEGERQMMDDFEDDLD